MTGSTTTTQRRVGALAALAAAGALAMACASAPQETGASYQEQVSRWNGGSEAELVTTWGMPQETHVLADGGRIIEYRRSGEDESTCTTRFTLDRGGKIVRWWYTGTSCVAPNHG